MLANFSLYVPYLDVKTWEVFKDHTRTIIIIQLSMEAMVSNTVSFMLS